MASAGFSDQQIETTPRLMARLTAHDISLITVPRLHRFTQQHIQIIQPDQVQHLTVLLLQNLTVMLARALNHEQIRRLNAVQRTALNIPALLPALLNPLNVAPYNPRYAYRVNNPTWLNTAFNGLPDNQNDLYRRIRTHVFLHHNATVIYWRNQNNIIPPIIATVQGQNALQSTHWCRARAGPHPTWDIPAVVNDVVQRQFDDAKAKVFRACQVALTELIDSVGGITIWEAAQLNDPQQAETYRRNLLHDWYQNNDPIVMSKMALGAELRGHINIDAMFDLNNAHRVDAQGRPLQQILQLWLEESFVDTMIATSNGYILPAPGGRLAAKQAAGAAWGVDAGAFWTTQGGAISVNDVALV